MVLQHSKPSDLALQIYEKLCHSRAATLVPPIEVLNNLFECLFYSSMCKEESDLVKVTVTFIDPSIVDPVDKSKKPERWSAIPFHQKLELSIKSLTKISKAADPLSTYLAVFFEPDGRLYIWGLIDQALHNQNFLNYESESGSEQPGLFQVSINDIGTLNVLFDYELIATLKQNILVKRYLDVFTIGPISKMMRRNADELKENVRFFLSNENPDQSFREWESFLDGLWIQTFSRLLLKIQNYNHGGAILIADQFKDIDIKYRIDYNRLSDAMSAYAKESIRNYLLENNIDAILNSGKRTIDKKLYLMEANSLSAKKGISNEIKGSINFIASQSCVDGVVLFGRNMSAKGFGAVLRSKKMPRRIYVSSAATASQKSLIETDPRHFGTRHRSMIAYCWNHPESLGFVISQDGDIRAFTRIEDRLIMWENIKTQQYIKQILVKQKASETDFNTAAIRPGHIQHD